MSELYLRLPTPQDKTSVLAYKAEFLQSEDSMDGTAGLDCWDTFEEWYAAICDNAKEETAREGRVPATTLLAISREDNRVIGMIDIRHRLNDYLLQFGGHIGYSVRESERQKGYATQMLRLALLECQKMSMDTVLVTCYKDNIPSAKTILRNHGALENEVQEGDKWTQRYWISL